MPVWCFKKPTHLSHSLIKCGEKKKHTMKDAIALLLLSCVALAASQEHKCGVGIPCPLGQYCAYAPGKCGGSGVCQIPPTMCPELYAPMCGCDGKTYSGPCQAFAAGVSVKSVGACTGSVSQEGPICGNKGSRSEGWYKAGDVSSNGLITWAQVCVSL